jgi:hypothetical protein
VGIGEGVPGHDLGRVVLGRALVAGRELAGQVRQRDEPDERRDREHREHRDDPAAIREREAEPQGASARPGGHESAADRLEAAPHEVDRVPE